MKKFLMTLSILLTGIYFTSAINMNLLSGDKLDNSSWANINNIVNKINLDNNNLNIKGKLLTNSKICIGGSCLGECGNGEVWDGTSFSCSSEIKQIMAGIDYVVALTDDGEVYTWGNNNEGQLGLGDTNSRATPQKVEIEPIRKIDMGISSDVFAISENGDLYAWGFNQHNKLGSSFPTNQLTPKLLMSGVKDVDSGHRHTLILLETGIVKALGNNDRGQSGMSDFSGVTAISAGTRTSMALKDGVPYLTGWNAHYQLGNGSNSPQAISSPTACPGVSNIAEINTLRGHNVLKKNNGDYIVWGENGEGRLGLGDTNLRPTKTDFPIPGANIKQFYPVSSGGYYIDTNGDLYSWGYNGNGLLGQGKTLDELYSNLEMTKIMSGVDEIISVYNDAFVRKINGEIWAWGKNGVGQLLNGDTEDKVSPIKFNFIK